MNKMLRKSVMITAASVGITASAWALNEPKAEGIRIEIVNTKAENQKEADECLLTMGVLVVIMGGVTVLMMKHPPKL